MLMHWANALGYVCVEYVWAGLYAAVVVMAESIPSSSVLLSCIKGVALTDADRLKLYH